MGDPRAHPASPGRPGPVLTTSHDDDQVQVDPSLAQHGLRQLRAPGSNLGQTTRRHGHGGRPRRPRPSQAVRLPAPPPHPATSLPVGHRDAQTPNAGHWTPGRSDARTGHRSPGQAPGGHRTLAPDTGHRMPDTNADTVTTPQPASGPSLAAMPSDRTLRRAPVLCPRTTRQPLGRLAGQAAPRRTAVVCWIWMVRVEGNGTTER
jgi:hypothetical protein